MSAHIVLASQLSKLTSDEVFDVLPHVKKLADDPGHQAVVELLAVRASMLRAVLMQDTVHEQARYASVCAEIRGIELALGAPEALQAEAKRREEAAR